MANKKRPPPLEAGQVWVPRDGVGRVVLDATEIAVRFVREGAIFDHPDVQEACTPRAFRCWATRKKAAPMPGAG